MKNLINRAKYVLEGEDGASNIEIIVWMSVVLVIATVLFMFKDTVIGFLESVIDTVSGFEVG